MVTLLTLIGIGEDYDMVNNNNRQIKGCIDYCCPKKSLGSHLCLIDLLTIVL